MLTILTKRYRHSILKKRCSVLQFYGFYTCVYLRSGRHTTIYRTNSINNHAERLLPLMGLGSLTLGFKYFFCDILLILGFSIFLRSLKRIVSHFLRPQNIGEMSKKLCHNIVDFISLTIRHYNQNTNLFNDLTCLSKYMKT